MVRAPAPGTGGSRVRFLPGPRAGVARCNLHFKATCAEQLAQSKLHRATCADQLAPTSLRKQLTQSNLRRATCTEQLAQSNLQGAQFAQSNLQGATCRDQLAGATCAEQLAQSNLHSATCVEELAQTNLHRPVCAEHLAWCCLALASQILRVGMQRWADLACDGANRGLVCFFFSGVVGGGGSQGVGVCVCVCQIWVILGCWWVLGCFPGFPSSDLPFSVAGFFSSPLNRMQGVQDQRTQPKVKGATTGGGFYPTPGKEVAPTRRDFLGTGARLRRAFFFVFTCRKGGGRK